jgi:predicted metal-dependent peptidase
MTANNSQEVKLKLSKARTGLILDQPFFGSLALRMPMVEDKGIPTLCTDGKQIRYNPDFVAKLTLDETKGVLAHEVMHPAMQHHTRRGEREPRRFNQAADYAINPILKAARFTLPEGHLDSPAYHGKGAEEIYSMLPVDPPKGKGKGGGGDSSDP